MLSFLSTIKVSQFNPLGRLSTASRSFSGKKQTLNTVVAVKLILERVLLTLILKQLKIRMYAMDIDRLFRGKRTRIPPVKRQQSKIDTEI